MDPIPDNVTVAVCVPHIPKEVQSQIENTVINYWEKLWNELFAHDNETSATLASIISDEGIKTLKSN